MKEKMKKQKLDCCGCGCEENSKNKQEVVKVYFCPKCKSKEVGFMFTIKNIFGILPKMKCRKCGFEAAGFPILVVSKEHLKKLNNKRKKR